MQAQIAVGILKMTDWKENCVKYLLNISLGLDKEKELRMQAGW
jgi:hypothetical protein